MIQITGAGCESMSVVSFLVPSYRIPCRAQLVAAVGIFHVLECGQGIRASAPSL